jgi:hypothetical protein
MNWSSWFYGLVSAVLNSVGGAIILVLVDPMTFNLQDGLPKLAKVCALFALIAFGNYIKNTPPPKPSLGP